MMCRLVGAVSVLSY